MDLTYFKRYRMEVDLDGRVFDPKPLPAGYRLLGWDETLIEGFALAKFLSFRQEVDAHVFPCLGELSGCRRLMAEIARKPGFLPQATWLLSYVAPGSKRLDYCGTVQGVRDRAGMGAIQNLGVTPEHRNLGLGTTLLFHAFAGFRSAGVSRVHLEVTSQNTGAIRLYQRLGFVVVKTVFKAAEVAAVR
ncbi:MAG: GNAT family N-acetyltransferase [Planctomycetota bacterium]